MRRRALRATRAWLRRTFGILPLFEVRTRTLGWPSAVWAARREYVEVKRLRARVVVAPALVTTIVPTYRRPESLVRAVHSALAQTVSDHVVLVVDDGGGLPALPDDRRLVAVSLSRNSSRAGVVRNVGMALSSSTYLAFLDDDNEWHPDHLAVALEALGRGADLVYTGMERVHPDGTRLDVLSRPFDRRALAHRSFVDTNCVVVRRGSGVRFSRLPRSHPSAPGEDWEFAWRLSRRKRISHVPEITVTYLVNPDSYYTRWETDDPL